MIRTFGTLLFFMIGLLTTGPAALAESASTAPTARVMIVLDASGSMWGRIDGKPKIAIARDVIRGILKGWDPKMDLGLTVYGHRRKGSCTDIQTLIPVGKPNVRAIMRAVDAINPKGKTPLSEAVRRAAEALKYTEERATVILISDGRETCGADPCAVGRALEKSGVDFTAHVIGFDVKRGEQAGLRCLAKATGGRFFAAKNAAGLRQALTRTVSAVKTAAAKPRKTVQQARKAKPKPRAAGVKLVAVYKEGGETFAGQINWYILDPKADLAGKHKKITEAYRGRSGQVFRKLAPGRYLVRAQLSNQGHITREFEITVKAGEAAVHTLVLNVGTVRFDAKLSKGGPAFPGALAWKVLSPKADLSGKRRKLTSFYRVKSGGVFILPAGTWLISGYLPDAGYVTTSKQITVAPGGEEAHEFVFNAGTVRFDAKLSKDGPAFPGALAWVVLSPKADLSGKRRKITSFYRVKTGRIFILPAGTWLISGYLPDARHVTTSQEITVPPGGEEAHQFVFGAGTIRVDVTKGGAPYGRLVGWDVYEAKADLAGKRRKIMGVWRVKSGRVTTLKAGDYVVTAVDVDQRATKGETALSIKAGEEVVVTVDLKGK